MTPQEEKQWAINYAVKLAPDDERHKITELIKRMEAENSSDDEITTVLIGIVHDAAAAQLWPALKMETPE